MKNLFLIFLFILGISSYAQDLGKILKKYNDQSVPYISVEETRRLQIRDSIILLDARELEEFEVSHLPGANYIGHRKFSEEKLLHNIPNNSASIVVYCSIGVRSEQIAERLKQLGYINVRNLYGGIFEWVNQGFPVQDKDENLTEKVHAYSKTWGKYLKKGEKVY